MVRDMKYRDKPYIAESIAEIMAERAAGEADIMDADIIASTPMHISKKRKRGYNQAELIAAHLAKLLGIRYAPDIITKIHPTEALSTKNRDERALLLADAFDVTSTNSMITTSEKSATHPTQPEAVQPCAANSAPRILLIDDVFTTGATADACTQALYKAGAASVDLYVFATGAVGTTRKI
jgi:predicted amidophosphoribosyltransferase